MAKGYETEASAFNVIAAGTMIKGDIKSNGDIRIDGTIIGSVHSKGKVVVGDKGIVEGEIVCQSGDFSGNVKATVTVSELLTLKASAKMNGDLVTNKLAIEPGARFSGTCKMDENPLQKHTPIVETKKETSAL